MDDFQRRFPRTVAMVESQIAAQNIKESAQHIHQHRKAKSERVRCEHCLTFGLYRGDNKTVCLNCGRSPSAVA
jgi:hypothetical protein